MPVTMAFINSALERSNRWLERSRSAETEEDRTMAVYMLLTYRGVIEAALTEWWRQGCR